MPFIGKTIPIQSNIIHSNTERKNVHPFSEMLLLCGSVFTFFSPTLHHKIAKKNPTHKSLRWAKNASTEMADRYICTPVVEHGHTHTRWKKRLTRMENVAKMTDASSFSFSRLCAVYIPWFKGDIKNSSKIKIDSLCVSIYFPHAFISHSHNALAVQDVFFFIFIFFPLSRCEQNDWNKKHLSIRTISRRKKN